MRESHLSESTEGICYMVYSEQGDDIDFICNFAFDEVETLKSLPDIGDITIELLEIEKWKENVNDEYKMYKEKDFQDVVTFKEFVKRLVDIARDLNEWDQFYINGLKIKGNQFKITIKEYFINMIFNSKHYSGFNIVDLIKHCLQFEGKIAEEIWINLKNNKSKYVIVDYKGRILEIWDRTQFDWEKFSKINPENYK